MNHFKALVALIALSGVMQLNAQTFTDFSNLLQDDYNSGGCVGMTDMDGNGYDDIILLDNSHDLKILYNTGGTSLTEVDYGPLSSSNQWGFTVGDLENDGHNDVISGGSFDGIHLTRISTPGVASDENLQNGQLFMQGCNFADIDNDGSLDYFACHDVGLSRIWQNDGNGALNFTTGLIDLTDYDPGAFTNTDHSGNYGSVWTDFDNDGDIDLYIAKCRQGVSNPDDPRRINQLWINNGDGTWTEDALGRGLVLYEQSWTADFADYDNDGDFDCLITNHSDHITLLENDGNGFFTDVSDAAGLASYSGFFLQAKMVDFDNDGFNDIVWAGGLHAYLRNNGDGTFSEQSGTFPYGNTMNSFAIGDFNKDGFQDLYASYGNVYVSPDYGNPDKLWVNDGNANNWVGFELTGTQSNLNAVGAKAFLYGAWGTQVREVRAGESYGIVNTFDLHFGIGQSTQIDSVVIQWPSGIVTQIENPGINTYHSIIEAECQVSGVDITSSGSNQLCPGESLTLTAPAGFSSYDWNTGETSSSITVAAGGNYTVVVEDALGCLGASAFIVEEVVAVAPTIAADGALEFCEGGSVVLTSSAGESYDWSTGDSGQSLTVTTSGSYSVAVTGLCANQLTSDPVTVTVFDAPAAPMVDDVTLPGPGSATLSGMGNNLHWYANEFDANPLFVGNSFDTPVLNTTTSYWVEDVNQIGGLTGVGGQAANDTNNGQFHTNSSYWLLFDAETDIILDSVKVFAGNTGTRTVQLIDANNTVIEQAIINIPAGESYITLDFFVPEGTGYGLRTADGNPQLWRDAPDANLSYPYDVNGLATITSSSIEGANAQAYYYFFYDWHVSTPMTLCYGERTEVTVFVPDGCTDPAACNYDPLAILDDGSCILPDGCTNEGACNYDPSAQCDDGSCTFPQSYFADSDGDGFGAGPVIELCAPQAGFVTNGGDCDDNNEVVFPGAPGTGEGIDNNCNGTIDPDEEEQGCLGDFNQDGLITSADFLDMLADFGCISGCSADLTGDDVVGTDDLLILLSLFGSTCE